MNPYKDWMMNFYRNRMMNDKNGRFVPDARSLIAKKKLTVEQGRRQENEKRLALALGQRGGQRRRNERRLALALL